MSSLNTRNNIAFLRSESMHGCDAGDSDFAKVTGANVQSTAFTSLTRVIQRHSYENIAYFFAFLPRCVSCVHCDCMVCVCALPANAHDIFNVNYENLMWMALLDRANKINNEPGGTWPQVHTSTLSTRAHGDSNTHSLASFSSSSMLHLLRWLRRLRRRSTSSILQFTMHIAYVYIHFSLCEYMQQP